MTTARPQIKKLAVLLDSSTSDAERQLPWARMLARSHDMELTLLHVVDPAHVSEPIDIASAVASDYLNLLASGLRAEGLRVNVEVRVGLVFEEWYDLARDGPGWALMMPGSSAAGLSRLLNTDAVSDVIHGLATPVLVVPPSVTAPERLRRVVVGTDGAPLSEAILDYAREMAPGPSLEVIEVQIIERGGLPDHQLTQLRATITDQRISIRGRPGPCILAAAKVRNADLVVVGAHSKSGRLDLMLGSTSDWLAHNSTKPVVIVPHAWLQRQASG